MPWNSSSLWSCFLIASSWFSFSVISERSARVSTAPMTLPSASLRMAAFFMVWMVRPSLRRIRQRRCSAISVRYRLHQESAPSALARAQDSQWRISQLLPISSSRV